MPNKCAAYGCSTNYDSLRKKFVDDVGEKISTFYFPINNPTLLPLGRRLSTALNGFLRSVLKHFEERLTKEAR